MLVGRRNTDITEIAGIQGRTGLILFCILFVSLRQIMWVNLHSFAASIYKWHAYLRFFNYEQQSCRVTKSFGVVLDIYLVKLHLFLLDVILYETTSRGHTVELRIILRFVPSHLYCYYTKAFSVTL